MKEKLPRNYKWKCYQCGWIAEDQVEKSVVDYEDDTYDPIYSFVCRSCGREVQAFPKGGENLGRFEVSQ